MAEAIAAGYVKVRSIPAAVRVESAGAWAYMAVWFVLVLRRLRAPKRALIASTAQRSAPAGGVVALWRWSRRGGEGGEVFVEDCLRP